LKFHYQCPRICITCVGDQGLKAVQIVVHCTISLVVGSSFQSVDHVHFCICREEVQLELLFKFSPGLDGENASVRFLMEYVFGPLGSTISLEERESPENPFLFVMELLWG